MTQNSYYSPQPPAYGEESPKDSSNRTTLVIILVIVGLFLCCICAIVAALLWFYGDAIVEELGLNTILSVLGASRFFLAH